MASIKLRVGGMSCGHCQEKVEQALRKTEGVYSAVVNLSDGAAEVDFDDDLVTTGQLVSAIQKAGYQAKLAG
jgi:copper chaperone CopZ